MQREDAFLDCGFMRAMLQQKIRVLLRRPGFAHQDREDLRQDILFRVLKGLHSFDPTRGHPNAFLATLVERAVSQILRERSAQKRNCSQVVFSLRPEDQPSGVSDPPPNHSNEAIGSRHYSDLALDLEDLLAKLTPELRAVADLLQQCTIAEAARELAIPRSTLMRRVKRLRREFEDAGLRIYL